jgi:hypothetical protein
VITSSWENKKSIRSQKLLHGSLLTLPEICTGTNSTTNAVKMPQVINLSSQLLIAAVTLSSRVATEESFLTKFLKIITGFLKAKTPVTWY